MSGPLTVKAMTQNNLTPYIFRSGVWPPNSYSSAGWNNTVSVVSRTYNVPGNGNYVVQNAILQFDTQTALAGVPSSHTITEAVVSLKVERFQGTPASPGPYDLTADYHTVLNNTAESNVSLEPKGGAIEPFPMSDLVPEEWVHIPLLDPDGNINRDGLTALRFQADSDEIPTEPSGVVFYATNSGANAPYMTLKHKYVNVDPDITPVTLGELSPTERQTAMSGLTKIIVASLSGEGPSGISTNARDKGATVLLPDGPGKWKAVTYSGEDVVRHIRTIVEYESGKRADGSSGFLETRATLFHWEIEFSYEVDGVRYYSIGIVLPAGIERFGNLYAWAVTNFGLFEWAHPSGDPPRQTGVVRYGDALSGFKWRGSVIKRDAPKHTVAATISSYGYDWVPANFSTSSRGGPETDFNENYSNEDVAVAVSLYESGGEPWDGAPEEDPGPDPAGAWLYWTGGGWSPEEPEPAVGACHVVQAEGSGEIGVACPQEGLVKEAEVVVELWQAGEEGPRPGGGTILSRLSQACSWRTQGGAWGRLGTEPHASPLTLGHASLSLPPRASLCPLDGSSQSLVRTLLVLPSGAELNLIIPDAAAVRLEELIAPAASAPTNDLVEVAISGPSFGIAYVALEAPASWTRSDGSTAVMDAGKAAVRLGAGGTATVLLPPSSALRAQGGSEPRWVFRLPGAPEPLRVRIPDVASVNLAEVD